MALDQPDPFEVSYDPVPYPQSRAMSPPAPAPTARGGAEAAAIAGLAKEQDVEIGIRERAQAEMGPSRQRFLESSRKMEQTSQEELNRLRSSSEDVKEFKRPDMRQSSWEWMGLAAAFGALAGSFSRYHTTTALNAFGGAMKGWAEGNAQLFNQKYDEWKANADKARINNERSLREYNLVMANQRLNLDQKMQEMEMIGAKYQDQLALSLARQKNFTQMAQLLDKREQMNSSLELKQQQIEVAIAKLAEMSNPDKLNLNTPGGLQRAAQIVADPKTDEFTKQFIIFGMSRATGTSPPELPKGEQAKDPNSWRAMFERWANPNAGATGATAAPQPAAAPAGAPAAPAPAAPAAAAPPTTIAPPAGSEGEAVPVSAPQRAAQAVGRDIAGAGQRTPTGAAAAPGFGARGMRDVIARNARAGRDGKSAQGALRLTPGQEGQEAQDLPDGTWIIDPRNNQPVQLKRKAPGVDAAQQQRDALGAL